jgi:hypothetical protein
LKNKMILSVFVLLPLLGSCVSSANGFAGTLIGTWTNYSSDYASIITIKIVENRMSYQIGKTGDRKIYEIAFNKLISYKKNGRNFELVFFNEYYNENVKWIFSKDYRLGLESQKYIMKNEGAILFKMVFIDRGQTDNEQYSLLWRVDTVKD